MNLSRCIVWVTAFALTVGGGCSSGSTNTLGGNPMGANPPPGSDSGTPPGGDSGTSPGLDAGSSGNDSGGPEGNDAAAPDTGTGDAGALGTRCTNPTYTSPVGSQTLCNTNGQGNPNAWHSMGGGWDIYDNMWNCTANCTGNNCEVLGTESVAACSTSSWFSSSNQWSQGGAVMTFPAMQYNFNNSNGTPISNYSSMTSTFSEVAPHVGIYEITYDIWLNAIANPPTSTEVMIWVDNFGQTPAGSVMGSATLGGVTYAVWVAGPGQSYIAFVPAQPFSSGTIDLLAFFHWIMSQGWIGASSSIYQIGFGPEIVSTQTPPTANNGHSAPFYIDHYTLDCSPACN